MTRVTLLAPAFNEEEVIEQFAKAALAEIPADWELLIVDDGSTDKTPRILEELVEFDPRVRVLTHESNRGMGAALATGFRAAGGSVIVCMDADLSHPMSMIKQLADGCEESDAVYGSRYVPGGGMQGIPWQRAAISRTANLILRMVFGTKVKDLTTGLRAYRTDAVRSLHLIGRGFETQLEITIRLIASGKRIDEIPLILVKRARGESKMRYLKLFSRYGRMVFRLLRIRWLPGG